MKMLDNTELINVYDLVITNTNIGKVGTGKIVFKNKYK